MFFQYNPEAAVWGNMSWNHAISNDMIHWKNLPVAFTVTPGGPDAAGCFSGSTLSVPHNDRQRVYALYTGVVRDKEHETIRNEGLRESQCLSWSDDPLLRVWHKRPTPIIPLPPNGLRVTGFRDPSVWRHGSSYLMGVGSGIEAVGGCMLLYRSDDLLNWKYLHYVAAGSWTGAFTSNPVDDGEMWECPELFPLDGGHVLIYSSLRRVFWQSGVLDPATLRFTAKNGGMLDFGAFYAPKTQLDAKGRRILWGWIPEKRSEDDMRNAGWSGMVSLPRVLRLEEDGTLRMEALPELSVLRTKAIPATVMVSGAKVTLPGSNGEVICNGRRGEPFEITIGTGSVLVRVQYAPQTHRIRIGDREAELPVRDDPSVHVFVDGSVIEIFVSGRVAYTQRFYYEGPSAPAITVRTTGSATTLRSWSLDAISTDRLTTLDRSAAQAQ